MLNHTSTINNDAIDRLHRVPFGEELDAVPTFEEMQQASYLLCSGKAPGKDSMPAEVYKEGDAAVTKKPH